MPQRITAQTMNSIPGIKVGNSPQALGLNPNTNLVYVANGGSNTVSVIDGITATTRDIFVGINPSSVAVNPNTNLVYVANGGSNTIAVIDSRTNKLVAASIFVGKRPSDLAVNPITNMVYVANSGSDTVSVINATNNKKLANDIKVGREPSAIAANPITKEVYVASSHDDTVSIIDGKTNTLTTTLIHVGKRPSDLAVNPITNMVYVANSASDTVSVINASDYSKIKDILVGKGPSAIGINPNTNMVYVANSASDTISIVNATDNVITRKIGANPHPSGIAINPAVNIVYVANSASDTISVIDAHVNRYVVGITFNVMPADSGYIMCSDYGAIATNIQIAIAVSTPNDISRCTAIANEGFLFSSWSESLGPNSSRPVTSSRTPHGPLDPYLNLFLDLFNIGRSPDPAVHLYPTNYGNFVAHFRQAPPPVQEEVLLNQYNTVTLAILTGLLIPHLIPWIKKRKSQHILKRYLKQITSIENMASKYENMFFKRLDNLHESIFGLYTQDKIKEPHFKVLQDKISTYYEEEYRQKVDSLINSVDKKNTHNELDELKNQITITYAKGKMTEQHYKILNEKISDYENKKTHEK